MQRVSSHKARWGSRMLVLWSIARSDRCACPCTWASRPGTLFRFHFSSSNFLSSIFFSSLTFLSWNFYQNIFLQILYFRIFSWTFIAPKFFLYKNFAQRLFYPKFIDLKTFISNSFPFPFFLFFPPFLSPAGD